MLSGKTRLIATMGLALAFIALAWGAYGGYLTDDSYIHFVYARNLLEGEGFSFNAGQPSYGSTSPLWVVILAAGGLTGTQVPLVAQAVSLLFAGGCVLALTVMAGRIGASPLARALPPLALVADPWFQRWAVSGMEVGLAALLALFAFHQVFVSVRKYAPLSGGLLLGLGLLARPETALLVVLTGIVLLVSRRVIDLLWLAVATAIPTVGWAVFAYLHFGTVLPNSFVVKTRQVPSALHSLLDSAAIVGASTLVPVAFIIAASLAWFWLRPKPFTLFSQVLPWLLPLVWLVGSVTQYSHRGVNVATRYICLFTPLLLLSSAWWMNRAHDMLGRFTMGPKGAAVLMRLVLAAAVLQPTAVGLLSWKKVKRAEQSYSENHHAIANWLARQSDGTPVVATYDVGIIAYRTRLPIVDLAGLTDTAATRALRRTLQERIRSTRPDYVVLQGKRYSEFLERNPDFVSVLQPTFYTEMYWGPGPQALDVFTVYRGHW